MKYRTVGLALLLAAALGACVFAPQALADSNARIVRLSYVDGQVQIDRRDGRGFEQAFLNMPLAPTTRVTTRDDGRAEIEFEDMSTVRLTPDTLVETQSLDLRSSGSKYTLVDLQDGTAYFNIRTLEGDDDFRVTVGRREFSLTRASRFRLRVDRAQVVLAVFKGELNVTDESGRLTVRKNETLTLDLEDPSRYYLAKGADQDRYDDWDRERDEYRDRYASEGSYRGYSSAYSYGVADLNYWGGYTYISGYGYMWRPRHYGIGWNPYSNGGWYWYPGSGWIWVSAYPWGWMPFRYGSWYYIGGHGWCWRPGRHWNRWSPVVAVHNPPAGHVVPTPPPPTVRRDPVLVGRGPATILPPGDPGPGRGRRDPDAIGRRGGSPAAGGGSGVVGAPGSGSGGATSGGSGVTAGGGAVGPGRIGQQPVGSGGRGSRPVREVDLEDAIHNARERRLGGSGQSGGVITNSGPGSSAPSSGSPSSGGSGAASQGVSPTSGRARVPESRRVLPESMTRDSSTPASTSGSSGGTSSYSGGSGSSSGAVSPSVDRSPSSRGGRFSEPRGEAPRGSYMQSSGPSRSASSSSAGSGSSRASSGASGGSSSRSSSAPSSGSSGGSTSAGSSGSGSSGRSSGGGSSSGAGHSSSGGGSSSSGARSSASTTPK